VYCCVSKAVQLSDVKTSYLQIIPEKSQKISWYDLFLEENIIEQKTSYCKRIQDRTHQERKGIQTHYKNDHGRTQKEISAIPPEKILKMI